MPDKGNNDKLTVIDHKTGDIIEAQLIKSRKRTFIYAQNSFFCTKFYIVEQIIIRLSFKPKL